LRPPIAFDLMPGMTLGKSPTSEDAFRSGTSFCREHVSETSIYGMLYRESHRLFPDEAFADLFADIGRASVPPRIVSVVMVLQRLEGLSDREAADRITFDLRWKYAAGGLDFDYAGFVHTVLVDMRARLRRSARPNRIFETALEVAHEAGLIGRKRVLDSTALYDAVATQDTVTLMRSAIRALLRIVDEKLGAELRSCCKRDDDYLAPGKPSCDWDDVQAREALVDALARDAYAILAALNGRTLISEVMQAVKLVATVVGQDLEQRDDGVFRIARRVAKDRVISTVDPEARHGHKTAARGFDGYKGHIAIDPDSEIITATTVTAGNVSDGSVGEALVADVLPAPLAASSDASDADALAANVFAEAPDASPGVSDADAFAANVLAEAPDASLDVNVADALVENVHATDVLAAVLATSPNASGAKELATDELAELPAASPDASGAEVFNAEVLGAAPTASPDGSNADALVANVLAANDGAAPSSSTESESAGGTLTDEPQVAVRPADAVAPVEIYGDSSYGTAEFVEAIEGAGAEANVKVQPPSAPEGKFAKDAFEVNLTNNTVRCPAGALVVIRPHGRDGARLASFGAHCNGCALRGQCTDGKDGRAIRVHPHEATLQRSRIRQRDPAWKARYRGTRPKVERKIAHLMYRRHGGRRARMRGCARVTHDFALLSAAHNFRRLATLGVHYDGGTWRR
jgi:Transposase DDE domain/Transposase domain (DUF772)